MWVIITYFVYVACFGLSRNTRHYISGYSLFKSNYQTSNAHCVQNEIHLNRDISINTNPFYNMNFSMRSSRYVNATEIHYFIKSFGDELSSEKANRIILSTLPLFANTGEWEKCLELVNFFEGSGFEPTIFTYSTLMSIFIR